MRKLHKVALVVAAAGGLSATGAGPGFADAPAPYNGGAALPVSQPDAQAASYTGSQATARTYGTPAPQRATAPATEVTPQLNPTLNPQLNPQISPSTVAPAQAAPQDQSNLFRPYQECSPQSLLDANLPVALLANAETKGVNCTQANSQANSVAHAGR
jgi:hypothetical protein